MAEWGGKGLRWGSGLEGESGETMTAHDGREPRLQEGQQKPGLGLPF